MSQRRQYKNPPIEEALCEFRFAPGAEWDPTIPGKLQVKIDKSYSGKPRQQRQLEASFNFEPSTQPLLAMSNRLAKVQLPNEAGNRLVAVGPDVLSIHVLRPYSGWEDFSSRIEEALRAYEAVVGLRTFIRCGVRYVNRIVLPEQAVDMDRYFLCGTRMPEGVPDMMSAFVHRVEYAVDEHKKLAFTFASMPGEPDKSAFLLDLEASWEGPEKPLVDAMKLAADLRDREREAFEAVITDDLRVVFDA